MKTLNLIYCLRICFGAVAGALAALLVDLKVGDPLINGITIALSVYIITYYLLKLQFMGKVEKPTKILTMGIGIYFITFIFCWTLIITPFLAAPTATFTFSPENPVAGEPVTFMSTSVDPDGTIVQWTWNFGDQSTGTGENVTHTYSSNGEYTVRLTVVDDHGISMSNTTTIVVSPPT